MATLLRDQPTPAYEIDAVGWAETQADALGEHRIEALHWDNFAAQTEGAARHFCTARWPQLPGWIARADRWTRVEAVKEMWTDDRLLPEACPSSLNELMTRIITWDGQTA